MRRFCYRCGALEVEGGPLIQGLCQSCFMEENRLARLPSEVQAQICSRCNAYLVGKRWREPADKESALGDAAKSAVLSALRVARLTQSGMRFVRPGQADKIELRIEPEIEPRGVFVDIHARGKIHESQVEPHVEHARVEVKPKWTTCDVCGLRSAGYHEAILQVRSKVEIPARTLRDIKSMLEGYTTGARERNRAAFIAKIEEKPRGLDLYLSSTTLARRMASLLKTKFGAEIGETAKLIGRDRDGRGKFKVSVLARLPALPEDV